MRKLYIFGTPGEVGGAATKIRDLIGLLNHSWEFEFVVSSIVHKKDSFVRRFCDHHKVRVTMWNEFPRKAEGVGLAVCEKYFFSKGYAGRVKNSGLRLVWSNDMMWAFPDEAKAVKEGLVDRVIFVSQIQANAFQEIYNGVDSRLIPNYINPDDFPYQRPQDPCLTIGRLSRPDKDKYPESFPLFYEGFGIQECRFRVQAWDSELQKIYSWHNFDRRWEFLAPNKESAHRFLSSLDLFVYPLGHRFVESWGRSTAEAMLTGCVAIVPAGHHFHNMMEPGVSGVIFKSYSECKDAVRELAHDFKLRQRMGRAAAEHARHRLFSPAQHRALWEEALQF